MHGDRLDVINSDGDADIAGTAAEDLVFGGDAYDLIWGGYGTHRAPCAGHNSRASPCASNAGTWTGLAARLVQKIDLLLEDVQGLLPKRRRLTDCLTCAG